MAERDPLSRKYLLSHTNQKKIVISYEAFSDSNSWEKMGGRRAGDREKNFSKFFTNPGMLGMFFSSLNSSLRRSFLMKLDFFPPLDHIIRPDQLMSVREIIHGFFRSLTKSKYEMSGHLSTTTFAFSILWPLFPVRKVAIKNNLTRVRNGIGLKAALSNLEITLHALLPSLP